MKRALLILITGLMVITACKKENPDQQESKETVNTYFPLKVGNYWVYEIFQCDSGEINCTTFKIDTNYVSKDTVIKGETFYKIEGLRLFYNEPRYYRDSGDFIINHKGEIVFTIKDGNEIYNEYYATNQVDTSSFWYHQLQDSIYSIEVSAGKFDCLNFQLSLFRKIDNFKIEHNIDNMFGKNVGPVKESSVFVSNLGGRKRELIGFYVDIGETLGP
jgi:flagellar basal body rod protein FlgG